MGAPAAHWRGAIRDAHPNAMPASLLSAVWNNPRCHRLEPPARLAACNDPSGSLAVVKLGTRRPVTQRLILTMPPESVLEILKEDA
jgi:hypothetical protein